MVEKGEQFLQLINEQNDVQWNIVSKLSTLIKSDWQSDDIRLELARLVERHTEITKQINDTDTN